MLNAGVAQHELKNCHLASHFRGPPLVCSPHPTEKGRPTSLKRGEGLAATVPGRIEGEEREVVVVVVVVGDKSEAGSTFEVLCSTALCPN